MSHVGCWESWGATITMQNSWLRKHYQGFPKIQKGHGTCFMYLSLRAAATKGESSKRLHPGLL